MNNTAAIFFILLFVFLYPATGKCGHAGSDSDPACRDTVGPSASQALTGSWQLFVDDYLVDKKENIRRIYHPFAKYTGNPVLVADKPWEGRMAYVFGTVLPAEKGRGYRLWYQSWSGAYADLYATSQDGLLWTKPDLGLIDYKGSKANNIFLRRTAEDVLPQIIYTPWEKDPERRYKLLNYDYGRTMPDHLIRGYWGAYSPDGIHWTDVSHNPVLEDPGDVGNFVWDEQHRRYIGYPKIFRMVRGFNRRCVGFSATEDFEHWPATRFILAPDEADDHWVSLKNQRTEFYGLSGFPYESGYIGFLWIFHITDGNNDGPIYSELVSSRDGVHWNREEVINGERPPILPAGPTGTWDQGMIFTPNHPLMEGQVIKLWYGGSRATHGGAEGSPEAGIGLATLRKDGFASLDADKKTGVVTTKPLKNLHGFLRVNVDAANGSVKAEVLTESGKPLRGFSRSACESIRSDGTDLRVTWRHHRQLPDLKGPFRLRFIMKNAGLYSFTAGEGVDLFQPEKQNQP